MLVHIMLAYAYYLTHCRDTFAFTGTTLSSGYELEPHISQKISFQNYKTMLQTNQRMLPDNSPSQDILRLITTPLNSSGICHLKDLKFLNYVK